ncbi:MAG: sugar transporter [Prevotella sp.]|nr:sugar transporter [Prevotella sp.]
MQENLNSRSEVSRTRRTVQNSRMSVGLFLVQIAVGFYSRKIFLDCLGAEVIGLNTTLGNILSFLNLAELGIGTAMATSLYKPICRNDQETVCEILTVQGLLYRRIAALLCGMGCLVMLALPYAFPQTECGLLYVYVAFVVFLSGSVAGYLWNYRQILIRADQKSFKLQPWLHGVRYAKMALQIVFLTLFHWGVWGWLFWEFAGNVVTVFVINGVLKREYPWLRQSARTGASLLGKYHTLMVKTRQLFAHKLASFALEQTAPLIIYAFVSLSMVTYYGNYMLIIGYVATTLSVLYSDMGASIGNLVAEGSRHHVLDVFWELFSSRIWIAGVACFGLYLFVGPFIAAWIGRGYLLGEQTLLLLVVGLYIRLSRTVVDSFKEAYQLFGDVWAPAAEAVLNLGCSVLLGYVWGLDGILLGCIISQVLMVLLWKPYYLFSNGLKASWLGYYLQYGLHAVGLLACAVLSIAIGSLCGATARWLGLILSLIIYVVSSYALLLLTTRGMRMFTRRIVGIITQYRH